MRSPTYNQFREKLIKSAKERKIPIMCHYELTSRCNLDCKMCYVHTLDNAEALRRELNTEQWKQIFDDAYQAGMFYATLSGGECLLRKDFKELYLHLWKKNIRVTVVSNGTLINTDYIEFFKTYPPDMIQISLYGSNEDGYLRVTGHKGYDKTMTAIKTLEDAGIDVRVVTTPNKYMGDDFLNILHLCKENKLYYTESNFSLMPNRNDSTKSDYYLSEEQILRYAIAQASVSRPVSPVDDLPDIYGPMTDDPIPGMTCNAGSCSVLINSEGIMYPCAAVIEGGFNVLEVGFANAWKQTVEFASKVVNAKECVGCAYESVCPKCPAFRLQNLHSGKCNPSICELTRKLVAAGVRRIKQ